ncbi:hypothetical protein GCM10010429_40470 [Micromonospora olivasterospora]
MNRFSRRFAGHTESSLLVGSMILASAAATRGIPAPNHGDETVKPTRTTRDQSPPDADTPNHSGQTRVDNRLVAAFDGATATARTDTGCIHGVTWYAHRLGSNVVALARSLSKPRRSPTQSTGEGGRGSGRRRPPSTVSLL